MSKDETIVWVCGKWVGMIMGKPHPQSYWQLEGVFSLEIKALAACVTDNHFIAPIELDKTPTEECVSWPGLYYPRLETSKEKK